jgi:HAD superfamily hydrolase (TIGR01509 family)
MDWDGTLLDSYASDVRAYLAMFRALEIEWNSADLARHYSPDWYQVYRAAKVPAHRWAEADQTWRAAYAAERPALLPGARAVLRNLKRKFSLGLVTSGSRDRVQTQIRRFRFTQLFSACVFSEDTRRKKPDAAPLRLALKRLGAKPSECVYVGDTPEDVLMARGAGMPVIGVLGPFPSSGRMRAAKPDVLLQSIRELPDCLPDDVPDSQDAARRTAHRLREYR